MRRKFLILAFFSFTLFGLTEGCKDAGTEPPPAVIPPIIPPTGDTVSFSATVHPILLTNCAISGCHTGGAPTSGFNQSTYAGVRAGGLQFGTNVVIPGDSTNSKIIQKLRGTAGERMPRAGTYAATGLPDSLIVKIGTWIMQGANNN